MSVPAIKFDASFTAKLLDQAAISFVRSYLFAKYGKWLVLACIVNAGGLALALWAGADDRLVLCLLVVVVVAGPLWLCTWYWAYPSKFSRRLKERFLPRAHFALSSPSFEVRTAAGSATIPWSRVRAVLEFPAYFILVFSPFAFSVLPSGELPVEAREILRAKGAVRVA